MPNWLLTTAKIAATLFVLTLINYTWQNHIEDRIFPKRWGVIEPGMLFRSGQLHANLVEDTLRDAEIRTVIDLRYWEEDPDMIAERDAISKLGLSSYRFPLNGDGTGNVDNYVEALTIMHQSRLAGEPVLLHCAAGSQRTGGAFAFYNSLVLGHSPEQVVSDMKDYSWKPGRDQILLDYLNENISYVAEQLVARGVIESAPEKLPVFDSPKRFWHF